MKQKIVIRVSMSCDKSRSKAMSMAARTAGVISMGITGDARDQLEVVGDGVDPVCLVSCLRKKLGVAHIVKVEEVKDPKPEEKKKEDPKPPVPVVCPPPPCYPGPGYYHHPYPSQMVVCDEPSNCGIM
ncbi:heavy metal-associated isoprenylated plant protein 46-like [Lolium rigidum]|uniref:heavy metal-associated isoprenylated plant protein 46-like n=1 Tax=Lolium rigidum TaxID=89674 RepID=UPI001F5C846B|nr:heavy metal-associated isoprenylated plant protein 46-like [Lolium rigidum]